VGKSAQEMTGKGDLLSAADVSADVAEDAAQTGVHRLRVLAAAREVPRDQEKLAPRLQCVRRGRKKAANNFFGKTFIS